MSSLELTSALTVLANAIAYKLSPSEVALLAGILVQLGDTLATLIAFKEFSETQPEPTAKM